MSEFEKYKIYVHNLEGKSYIAKRIKEKWYLINNSCTSNVLIF